MRIVIVIITLCALLGATVALAQSEQPGLTGAGHFTAGTPDTVRTNLWLFEALMNEIVTEVVDQIPPAPTSIRLIEDNPSDQSTLFLTVLTSVLSRSGYELFLPTAVDAAAADTVAQETVTDGTTAETAGEESGPELELTFRVLNAQLEYPNDERRFGIWRQWVSRRVAAGVLVTVTQATSGRILFRGSIDRTYRDRVSDEFFPAVNSPHYGFTTAAAPEGSWWNRRLEQFVVLGTLSGLVAVYFANSN